MSKIRISIPKTNIKHHIKRKHRRMEETKTTSLNMKCRRKACTARRDSRRAGHASHANTRAGCMTAMCTARMRSVWKDESQVAQRYHCSWLCRPSRWRASSTRDPNSSWQSRHLKTTGGCRSVLTTGLAPAAGLTPTAATATTAFEEDLAAADVGPAEGGASDIAEAGRRDLVAGGEVGGVTFAAGRATGALVAAGDVGAGSLVADGEVGAGVLVAAGEVGVGVLLAAGEVGAGVPVEAGDVRVGVLVAAGEVSAGDLVAAVVGVEEGGVPGDDLMVADGEPGGEGENTDSPAHASQTATSSYFSSTSSLISISSTSTSSSAWRSACLSASSSVGNSRPHHAQPKASTSRASSSVHMSSSAEKLNTSRRRRCSSALLRVPVSTLTTLLLGERSPLGGDMGSALIGLPRMDLGDGLPAVNGRDLLSDGPLLERLDLKTTYTPWGVTLMLLGPAQAPAHARGPAPAQARCPSGAHIHDKNPPAPADTRTTTPATMNMDTTPMPMDMSTPMDMSGGSGSHMMMALDEAPWLLQKMWFHGGTMEMVVFDFWKVTDDGSMAYSWFIIFVLAFLYEGLKYYRDYLYGRHARNSALQAARDTSRLALDKNADLHKSWSGTVFTPFHLLQTFLHALQYFVSYLLMLIFMTYNSWLCLAVILGGSCGFFFFGWKKESSIDITEHCH
ncbi:hypothetical protein FOCC_FOCC003866 [Frankliniella occidentalis]|nr:hypothetical protein FOCC_FOCC003866 [Frankliniella occidentalis]